MKKENKQKGITLVALVITIIILLILAGISIQALTNTGLFGQAKRAKNLTEEKTAEENTTLENYLAKINEITGGIQGSAESSTNTTHTATTIEYSWDELSKMAGAISNNSSITNETLEVNVTLNGETKTLGVGDTATVDGKTVRILGFNHDELTNPETAYGTKTATGKAGISFEYVNFIDVSGTGAGTTNSTINSTNTNLGGWKDSELRNTLNETVYNSLSIKDKIKKVNKDYIPTYNNATTTTCSDYLWLLSCGEIWDNGYGDEQEPKINGTRGYAIATEGKQYEYYKLELGNEKYNVDTNKTMKENVWWLRSPDSSGDSLFCRVSLFGQCSAGAANYSHGIAPGFSI